MRAKQDMLHFDGSKQLFSRDISPMQEALEKCLQRKVGQVFTEDVFVEF